VTNFASGYTNIITLNVGLAYWNKSYLKLPKKSYTNSFPFDVVKNIKFISK
jgi:hypothetical protein